MLKFTPPNARITGGDLKGARLLSPRTTYTRPMSDKLRLAMFNALGDIKDLHVLDAFAGSGAIGLEALSRGVKESTFVDSNYDAIETIKTNCNKLEVQDRCTIYCITWNMAVIKFASNDYDLIFLDPPYDHSDPRMFADALALLAESGVIAVSWPNYKNVPDIFGAHIVKVLQHGKARIIFFKKD